MPKELITEVNASKQIDSWSEREKVFELSPGFFREAGGQCSLSLDGKNWVDVPFEDGQKIKVAAKAQDSVFGMKHPRIAQSFMRMNCRKTALVITGRMSLEDALKSQDVHGIQHLFADAARLQDKLGSKPCIGESQHEQIAHFLMQHPQQVPAIVHIFGVQPRHKALVETLLPELPWTDLSDSLHRYHTFVVYGKDAKDRWVCLHKAGSGYGQIGVVSLEDAVHSFTPSSEDITLLSITGSAY